MRARIDYGADKPAPHSPDPVRRLEVLQDENHLLQAALSQTPEGVALFNRDLQLIFCNRKMREGLDIPEAVFEDDVPTAEQFMFYAIQNEISPAAVESAGYQEAMVGSKMDCLVQGRPVQFAPFKNGAVVYHLSGSPVEGGGYLMLLELSGASQSLPDLIVREQMSSTFDALTGLPKLESFLNNFNEMLLRRSCGQVSALHYLDIDQFKKINRLYGRATGDEVLKQLSQRLSHLVPPTDAVARVSGDRFVVQQSLVVHPSDVTKLDHLIFNEIRRPYEINGYDIKITASMALALAPRDGLDARSLLAKAEAHVLADKARKPKPDMASHSL